MAALASDGRGGLWLATESGLWRGTPGSWVPLAMQPPLVRVNALLVLEAAGQPLLLAGGAPAAIVLSRDGGASWHGSYSDAIEAPITCLAASPRFAEDATLLAGTGGDGILRSTDGGRSWWLSNAGLQEFAVLALAVAPTWDEHETVFALTEGGLYQSPNGGRFWRRVADCGDAMPLNALAVSPRFASDGLVFAAGDLPGVVRSTDGGRNWALLAPTGDAPEAVNCLLATAGEAPVLIAGTAGGAIHRSDDGGAGWRQVAAGFSSVLALALAPLLHFPWASPAGEGEPDGRLAKHIAVGLLDEGLLLSRDGTAIWELEASLGLRDLTRLAVAVDGAPLAFGPTGGVWRVEDGSWRRLAFDDAAAPVTALLPRPDGSLLVATAETVVRWSPGGVDTEQPPGGVAATVLATHAGAEWLGDAAGTLWRRAPAEAWAQAATLVAGQAVAALTSDGAGGLIAATIAMRAGCASLWRSVDGSSWQTWLELPAEGGRAIVCPGDPAWAAAGPRVWRHDGSVWHADEPDGLPVVALLPTPDGALIAATTGGAYRRVDDGWERLAVDVPPGGLLDLVLPPSGNLLGLGRGGNLVAATLS